MGIAAWDQSLRQLSCQKDERLQIRFEQYEVVHLAREGLKYGKGAVQAIPADQSTRFLLD